jgi:peptidoglycan/LPS O-acetylase OafA/YrhL
MNRYRKRDTSPLTSLPSSQPAHALSKWLVWLVCLFFALSIVFFILAAAISNNNPDAIDIYVWGRVITELILGLAYFLFVYLFRKGKFWGYLRMLMTSAFALVSTLSVVFLVGDYPWWLRLEQAIQASVVIALLVLLVQPTIRSLFRKKEA